MYKFLKKHITTNNVQITILFIPLLYLLIRQIRAGEWRLEDFLDTSILTSFLLAFICQLIARVISSWIGRRYEDASKLTENYDKLVEKYSREKLFEYQERKFPIICLAFRKLDETPFEICIDESRHNVKYELPSQIKEYSCWLMKAHQHSITYNNMNVRGDNIWQDGNKVTITYSQTTYFDSLITNRAMDYAMENGKTIREIYEPGPFLSSLQESRFSNHIGFNGFIETVDNKFIFVLRSSKLSIGKNTLANSIGASLKGQYCLDSDRKLTLQGLSDGIRMEIEDELKIRLDPDERLDKNIFAFYRDLVEGGKPQFLFYYKLGDLTAAAFEENFRQAVKQEKNAKKSGVVDGDTFLFLTLQELTACEVQLGMLILPGGRKYKMMPSATASVGMLVKSLRCAEV